MRTFTVVVEIRYRGSACGSTTDEIEAESEAEAIEKVIAACGSYAPIARSRRS